MLDIIQGVDPTGHLPGKLLVMDLQGKAGEGKVGKGNRGSSRHVRVRHVRLRQGRAGQGRSRQCRAWQDSTGQCRAGQGRAVHDRLTKCHKHHKNLIVRSKVFSIMGFLDKTNLDILS